MNDAEWIKKPAGRLKEVMLLDKLTAGGGRAGVAAQPGQRFRGESGA